MKLVERIARADSLLRLYHVFITTRVSELEDFKDWDSLPHFGEHSRANRHAAEHFNGHVISWDDKQLLVRMHDVFALVHRTDPGAKVAKCENLEELCNMLNDMGLADLVTLAPMNYLPTFGKAPEERCITSAEYPVVHSGYIYSWDDLQVMLWSPNSKMFILVERPDNILLDWDDGVANA